MKKRKLFWLSGIVCFLMVFGSCVSQVVFDKDLPLKESTRLWIYYGVEVTEYNGIPVRPERVRGPNDPVISTWHDVYIPPGEAKFMVDISWQAAVTTYLSKNLSFSYKFDAGKYYTIMFTAFGGPGEDEWGVRIFDSPPPKIGLPKTENAIAFIPLLDAQGRTVKTVL
jgi:hypothetical protein